MKIADKLKTKRRTHFGPGRNLIAKLVYTEEPFRPKATGLRRVGQFVYEEALARPAGENAGLRDDAEALRLSPNTS